jgi:hypothetical protein
MGDLEFSIYNQLGQLKARKIYEQDHQLGKIELEVIGWEKGFYELEIRNESGVSYQKVLICE